MILLDSGMEDVDHIGARLKRQRKKYFHPVNLAKAFLERVRSSTSEAPQDPHEGCELAAVLT